LPRINTEFHGNKQKQRHGKKEKKYFRHGNKTHHSEPDASATVGQESRSIATDEHGITRKRQKQRHGKKEKKYFRHGNKTHHSEPDASATV
jgi:hypothetical protein